MFRFFRQIRQKLLSENRVTRYLLYALGEILLVVIGILIALQVNNWNQDRLDRSRSVEFHKRLVDDLNLMIERNRVDSTRAVKLVNYLNSSISILQEGELTGERQDTLDYTLMNFFQFVRIEKALNSYEEMKSTGQLGLIYDSQLRTDLSKYMALLEAISKIFDQLADKVNDTQLVDSYVMVNVSPNSHLDNTVTYDFDAMSRNQELINKLSHYALYWQTKKAFSTTLILSSQKLIEAINNEIEKLSP